MKTLVQKYDRMNGKDLCEITLINEHNVRATVLNYGATLEKLEIPTGNNKWENIIMSLATPKDYAKERNFLGGTVGRVAGRIKDGKWQHGNQITQFKLNDGQNSLHGGGEVGFDNKPWDFKVTSDKDTASVQLILFDPDGENNYPGNMKIIATYQLDNDNNLNYNITAFTDKTTLFNPTNHTFFRLDGPQSNVEDLNLQLNADYYVPVDDATMPITGMAKVADTVFDFRKPKRLGAIINSTAEPQIKNRNGLDHPFILNGYEPAAVLSSTKTNRKLIMSTDAQAVVVFSANTFNHQGAAKNIGRHDGITLEAQAAPESDYSLSSFTLVPGERFSRTINWQVVY